MLKSKKDQEYEVYFVKIKLKSGSQENESIQFGFTLLSVRQKCLSYRIDSIINKCRMEFSIGR